MLINVGILVNRPQLVQPIEHLILHELVEPLLVLFRRHGRDVGHFGAFESCLVSQLCLFLQSEGLKKVYNAHMINELLALAKKLVRL